MEESEKAEGKVTTAPEEGPLGEAFADLFGKILRRGRSELERAARRGRERLALRQLRSDRDRMYAKLGKETRSLLEAGEIEHPGLRKGVERIVELEAKLTDATSQLAAHGERVEDVEEEAP